MTDNTAVIKTLTTSLRSEAAQLGGVSAPSSRPLGSRHWSTRRSRTRCTRRHLTVTGGQGRGAGAADGLFVSAPRRSRSCPARSGRIPPPSGPVPRPSRHALPKVAAATDEQLQAVLQQSQARSTSVQPDGRGQDQVPSKRPRARSSAAQEATSPPLPGRARPKPRRRTPEG